MISGIIYIPGFGMTVEQTQIDAIKTRYKIVKAINPDWAKLSSIEEVADQIRDELNTIRNENPEVNFGIYGFSLGGDLLMDLINKNKFDIPPGSLVLMIDPNLNSINCFITRIAALSDSLTKFIDTLKIHNHNADNATNAHLNKYFDNIKLNITNKSAWDNFKSIALSVIGSANSRYELFIDTVRIDGNTLSGVPVKILLSDKQHLELITKDRTQIKFEWIETNQNLQHFNGMDVGTILIEIDKFAADKNLV